MLIYRRFIAWLNLCVRSNRKLREAERSNRVRRYLTR